MKKDGEAYTGHTLETGIGTLAHLFIDSAFILCLQTLVFVLIFQTFSQ